MLQLVYVLASAYLCVSQFTPAVVYVNRWKRVNLCAPNDVSSIESEFALYKTAEVWNAVITFARDFVLHTAFIEADKCGEGFYPCEKFMTMKFNAKTMLDFLETKGMPWATMWNAIHPKPNFPMVRKGKYNVINATLDGRKIAAMIFDFNDHSWKIKTYLNEKNGTSFCVNVEFYIKTYTRRERNNRKKGNARK